MTSSAESVLQPTFSGMIILLEYVHDPPLTNCFNNGCVQQNAPVKEAFFPKLG